MEFSKKILYIVGILTTAVVIATFVVMWYTQNVEPLQVLIPAIFAEAAAGTGFYYWKAKTENKIKITKQLILDVADQHGIENAIEIARVCFHD